ncbi:RING finger protein PSH1 [Spathaspora sp. JA1]|nr:RING finger protein PSH1 [Spathaspora sp. JA1]
MVLSIRELVKGQIDKGENVSKDKPKARLQLRDGKSKLETIIGSSVGKLVKPSVEKETNIVQGKPKESFQSRDRKSIRNSTIGHSLGKLVKSSAERDEIVVQDNPMGGFQLRRRKTSIGHSLGKLMKPSIKKEEKAVQNKEIWPKDSKVTVTGANILSRFSNDLKCCICLEIVISPMTTACGHTYCYVCLKKWFAKRLLCPSCNSEIFHMPVLNVSMNDLSDQIISLLFATTTDIKEAISLIQRRKEFIKQYETDLQEKQLFGGKLYSLTDSAKFAHKLYHTYNWRDGVVMLMPNRNPNPRLEIIDHRKDTFLAALGRVTLPPVICLVVLYVLFILVRSLITILGPETVTKSSFPTWDSMYLYWGRVSKYCKFKI